MMLVGGGMRVALATTHLALRDVPAAITRETVHETLRILIEDLRSRFGITRPRGMRVRRVTVTVDGRRVRVRRGKRMRATVDLRGRTSGTAVVRIRVDGTRRGRRATSRQTRAFRTCLAKR